jgi:hypothetical protein
MDAVVASFHRKAIPLLLPYTTAFDNTTWYASQAVLIYRAYCIYGYVLQFDWIGWDNNASRNTHSKYPKSGNPFEMAQSMFDRILPPWAAKLALEQGPRAPPNNGAISPFAPRWPNWEQAIPADCLNMSMMNLEHVGFEGPMT